MSVSRRFTYFIFHSLFFLFSSPLFCSEIANVDPPAEPWKNNFVTIRDEGNDSYSAPFFPILGSVIEPYQIEKYQITLSEWSDYLDATGHREAAKALLATGSPKTPMTDISLLEAMEYTNWKENNALSFEECTQLAATSGKQLEELLDAVTHTGSYTIIEDKEKNFLEVINNPEANYHLATTSQLFKARYYNGHGKHVGYTLPVYPTIPTSPGYSNIVYQSQGETFSRVVDIDDPSQHKSPYGVFDLGSFLSEWTLPDESLSQKMTIHEGALLKKIPALTKERPIETYSLFYHSPEVGFRLTRTCGLVKKEFSPAAFSRNDPASSQPETIRKSTTQQPTNNLSVEEKQKEAARINLILETGVTLVLIASPILFPAVLPLEYPLMGLYLIGLFGFARQTINDIITSL